MIGMKDSDSFLDSNWKINCIPENTVNMTIDDYEEFLEERRYLMAKKIINRVRLHFSLLRILQGDR